MVTSLVEPCQGILKCAMRARLLLTIWLWVCAAGVAVAEGVYECPGMPMRYTDGADDPYCRWVELSESKLIKVNPSPFAPERDVFRRREPDGPLKPLDERAPPAEWTRGCELRDEYERLMRPTSANGPTEVKRRQQLDRMFKLGQVPACRR